MAEQEQITELHKHELLDRIHSVNVMFDQIVVGHLAAQLMQAEIDAAVAMLADLYQKAGQIRFAD